MEVGHGNPTLQSFTIHQSQSTNHQPPNKNHTSPIFHLPSPIASPSEAHHPSPLNLDIYYLPDKPKADDVKELIEDTELKAVGGGYKLYIIPNGDNLSPILQNKLLKSIEEPHPYTVFLICVSNEDSLLMTVRSRCNRMYLPRVGYEVLKLMLQDHVRCEIGDVRWEHIEAAALSAGSVDKAIELMQDDAYMRLWQAALGVLREINKSGEIVKYIYEPLFDKENIRTTLGIMEIIISHDIGEYGNGRCKVRGEKGEGRGVHDLNGKWEMGNGKCADNIITTSTNDNGRPMAAPTEVGHGNPTLQSFTIHQQPASNQPPNKNHTSPISHLPSPINHPSHLLTEGKYPLTALVRILRKVTEAIKKISFNCNSVSVAEALLWDILEIRYKIHH
jgi:hypothetical protein